MPTHDRRRPAYACIRTSNCNEYLEIVEDLNLRILHIIEATGTQLTVPARSIKLEGG